MNKIREDAKLPDGVDPETTVVMGFEHLLCSAHGEPFRAQWPAGYIIVMGEFYKWWSRNLEFLTDEIMVKHAANKLAEKPTSDATAAFSILKDIPFCCRLSQSELVLMYETCKIGVEGKCEYCRKITSGTSMTYTNHWGRQIRFKHVCFPCWVKYSKSKRI